jgi:hypothetical protein
LNAARHPYMPRDPHSRLSNAAGYSARPLVGAIKAFIALACR